MFVQGGEEDGFGYHRGGACSVKLFCAVASGAQAGTVRSEAVHCHLEYGVRGHWDCAVVSEYGELDQGISKFAALSTQVGVERGYENVEVLNEKDWAASASLG